MIKYPNFLKPIASIVTTSFLGLTSLSQSLYAQETQVVSQNNSFNWYELWEPGSTQTTRAFTNVNGSGVDVTVEYSTNQKWQQDENHNGLNLYDKKSQPLDTLNLNDSHDLWLYHGILRMTNNPNDTGNDSAWLKMTFSQPVTISQLWAGSLSTIKDYREWMKVSAYSSDSVDLSNLSASANALVSPSKVDDYQDFFDTTCSHTTYSDSDNVEGDECNLAGADDPDYIGIFPNSDGSVTLKGLGSQENKQYGRAFFEYNAPVQTIIFEHYTTNENSDTQRNGNYTSVAISPELIFTGAFAD